MGAGAAARPSDPLRGRPASHVQLVTALLGELQRRDPDGSLIAAASDVAQAAELAASGVLDPSVLWLEQLGAFYDSDGVRRLLGRGGAPVSRQAVSKRKGLLALTTGSGRVVYPAVQFRDRLLAPGMDQVLDALPEALVSRWTVASWLVSPEAALAGERPIDLLFDGEQAVAAVVAAARRWAGQLAA